MLTDSASPLQPQENDANLGSASIVQPGMFLREKHRVDDWGGKINPCEFGGNRTWGEDFLAQKTFFLNFLVGLVRMTNQK